MKSTDYLTVTELAGAEATEEQLNRISHRYGWAGHYCHEKDVVEVACGSGLGLGYLHSLARSVEAGDISQKMVDLAKAHYGRQLNVTCFDAQNMPWEDASKDVVILFEAIYYLPNFPEFLDECRRVLRPRGLLLIATANKDLSDFNPSPYSHTYYGIVELESELKSKGFCAEYFGYMSVLDVSLRQRILRPVKRMAVKFGLVPKTMAGKKILKRFVFGDLLELPAEITAQHVQPYTPPEKLNIERNSIHKVLYCAAIKQG